MLRDVYRLPSSLVPESLPRWREQCVGVTRVFARWKRLPHSKLGIENGNNNVCFEHTGLLGCFSG